MTAKGHHPPVPGPFVQPNFLSIEEAISDVTFPISKKDLLEQVEEGTAIYAGRNVDLSDIISDLHDDFFASEAEFHSALETQFGPRDDEEIFSAELPDMTQDEALRTPEGSPEMPPRERSVESRE